MEVSELEASNQNEVEPEEAESSEQGTIFYTTEDLETLHPTAIDIEKVAPEARPIVEKTIKEYKNLQGDYTKKAQELSELKKIQDAIPEKHFEDTNKDLVFKDYLKNPLKVISDINTEIAKLESVVPDDGIEEYRSARRAIAQWQGIKDEFQVKKTDIVEKQRRFELEDAKVDAELGQESKAIREYAKSLGFSDREFSVNQALRERLKKVYKIENAATLAASKQTKPSPHKAASPSGNAGQGDSEIDVFDPKLSTAERIALFKKNK